LSSRSSSAGTLVRTYHYATLTSPLSRSRWILQRLAALRVEADANATRAEEAEAKYKKLEHEILVKDQEITSLQHKLSIAESEVEKLEVNLKEHKSAKEEVGQTKDTNEGLSRKIALLEEELDNAEKNLRETTDKYVYIPRTCNTEGS
jgi:tropomyosin